MGLSTEELYQGLRAGRDNDRTHVYKNMYCPCPWCFSQGLRSDYPGGARAFLDEMQINDRALKWNFKVFVETLLELDHEGIDWLR
jgi:hypothetical protein